jgi:hypothetical protein
MVRNRCALLQSFGAQLFISKPVIYERLVGQEKGRIVDQWPIVTRPGVPASGSIVLWDELNESEIASTGEFSGHESHWF